MAFDNIFIALGKNGKYQLIVFIFMTCAKGFAAIPMIMPVLIGFEMYYVCSTFKPSLEDYELSDGNLSYLLTNDSANHCPKDTNITCVKWTFKNNLMESSIMSQYMLVCDRTFLINISTSCFFVGIMFGTIAAGYVSDSYGRLRSFYACTFTMSVSSFAAAFAPVFWLFVLLRVIAGIGAGGLLTTLFTITTEIFPASNRVFYCFCVHQGLSGGILLFALIGYFLRNHVWLQVAAISPSISLLLALFFMHESPRWLYSKGDISGMRQVLKKIAKTNGVNYLNIVPMIQSLTKEKQTQILTKRQQFSILIHSRDLIKRYICASVCFFAANLSFFCAYLGVNSLMGGDIFVKLILTAAVEIPARFWGLLIAHKIGRRPNIMIAFLLGTISFCVSGGLAVNKRLGSWQIAMALVGKFWATVALESMWLYSAEIFPTSVRNMSISLSNLSGRIGTLFAAHVASLSVLWIPLPFVAVGIVMLSACVTTIFLPEMRNAELPEASDFIDCSNKESVEEANENTAV